MTTPAQNALIAAIAALIPTNGRGLVTAANVRAALTAVVTSYRTLLLTSATFYVAPGGNDANDGATLATAFATPQGAYNNLKAFYDFGGQDVNVVVADGTYGNIDASHGPLFIRSPWEGGGTLSFTGSVNAVLNATGAANNCVDVLCTLPGQLILNGLKYQSDSSAGVVNEGPGAVVVLNNATFGTCAYVYVDVANSAQIVINTDMTINTSSPSQIGFKAGEGGCILQLPKAGGVPIDVNLIGSPQIGIMFFTLNAGLLVTNAMNFVGNPADGCVQFIVELGGVYNTTGKIIPPTAIINAVWSSTAGGQTTLTLATPVNGTIGNPINVTGVVSSGGSGAGFNRSYTLAATVLAPGTTVVLNDPRGSSPGTYSSGGKAGYPVGTVTGISAPSPANGFYF